MEQSAFIKGRNIDYHTQLILDFLDYNSLIWHEKFILFSDFFKAFDTLEHPVLFKTLEMFGFRTSFCNVTHLLYKDINSSVSLSHGFSNRFPIKQEIQKGCPISFISLLFILATEMIAILLKNSQIFNVSKYWLNESIIIHFADNTALFL